MLPELGTKRSSTVDAMGYGGEYEKKTRARNDTKPSLLTIPLGSHSFLHDMTPNKGYAHLSRHVPFGQNPPRLKAAMWVRQPTKKKVLAKCTDKVFQYLYESIGIFGVDLILQGTERSDLFTHERGNTGWNKGQWGMRQV